MVRQTDSMVTRCTKHRSCDHLEVVGEGAGEAPIEVTRWEGDGGGFSVPGMPDFFSQRELVDWLKAHEGQEMPWEVAEFPDPVEENCAQCGKVGVAAYGGQARGESWFIPDGWFQVSLRSGQAGPVACSYKCLIPGVEALDIVLNQFIEA
jgi:hypothetical protein